MWRGTDRTRSQMILTEYRYDHKTKDSATSVIASSTCASSFSIASAERRLRAMASTTPRNNPTNAPEHHPEYA
jgi:hypothetical protein